RSLLWRAPAAARDPAPHRGPLVGGVHPRRDPRAAADRGGREGRRPLVHAGGTRGSAVAVKSKRPLAQAALAGWLTTAALVLLGWSEPASAQDQPEGEPPIIERVEIQGNQFLQKETLLFYIGSRPGDRYDERRLREDFRRLWDTGFLGDMLIDVRDGPKGKIVTFQITERR